ncbi:uncharacterized protein LOC101851954 [Aplysia californica]|uniref:Uncharacterized protein LOC101851954 n=1 Tax=Aplysia californica TaxID=6500 RepID=A0ABM0JR85_APLCA|nr:uncharacterized protein LOC101851954 [Aplysia californica]
MGGRKDLASKRQLSMIEETDDGDTTREQNDRTNVYVPCIGDNSNNNNKSTSSSNNSSNSSSNSRCNSSNIEKSGTAQKKNTDDENNEATADSKMKLVKNKDGADAFDEESKVNEKTKSGLQINETCQALLPNVHIAEKHIPSLSLIRHVSVLPTVSECWEGHKEDSNCNLLEVSDLTSDLNHYNTIEDCPRFCWGQNVAYETEVTSFRGEEPVMNAKVTDTLTSDNGNCLEINPVCERKEKEKIEDKFQNLIQSLEDENSEGSKRPYTHLQPDDLVSEPVLTALAQSRVECQPEKVDNIIIAFKEKFAQPNAKRQPVRQKSRRTLELEKREAAEDGHSNSVESSALTAPENISSAEKGVPSEVESTSPEFAEFDNPLADKDLLFVTERQEDPASRVKEEKLDGLFSAEENITEELNECSGEILDIGAPINGEEASLCVRSDFSYQSNVPVGESIGGFPFETNADINVEKETSGEISPFEVCLLEEAASFDTSQCGSEHTISESEEKHRPASKAEQDVFGFENGNFEKKSHLKMFSVEDEPLSYASSQSVDRMTILEEGKLLPSQSGNQVEFDDKCPANTSHIEIENECSYKSHVENEIRSSNKTCCVEFENEGSDKIPIKFDNGWLDNMPTELETKCFDKIPTEFDNRCFDRDSLEFNNECSDKIRVEFEDMDSHNTPRVSFDKECNGKTQEKLEMISSDTTSEVKSEMGPSNETSHLRVEMQGNELPRSCKLPSVSVPIILVEEEGLEGGPIIALAVTPTFVIAFDVAPIAFIFFITTTTTTTVIIIIIVTIIITFIVDIAVASPRDLGYFHDHETRSGSMSRSGESTSHVTSRVAAQSGHAGGRFTWHVQLQQQYVKYLEFALLV